MGVFTESICVLFILIVGLSMTYTSSIANQINPLSSTITVVLKGGPHNGDLIEVDKQDKQILMADIKKRLIYKYGTDGQFIGQARSKSHPIDE